MKASPILTSHNAGEFSPAMEGRVDIAKYPSASKLSENFLHLIQGPAMRRGGTYYIAGNKDSSKRSHLLKFEFSATQSFQLEFGDGYVRFFSDHGQVLVSGVAAWSAVTAYTVGDLVLSGGKNFYCIADHTNHVPPNATYWYELTGSIYEIPSIYDVDDLTNADGSCALDVEQSGDVLYITHAFGTYPAQILTRYGNTRWIFRDYDPDTGPFDDMNETAITLQASANTGAMTLTASASLFVATDVGRLVRLESQNLTVKPWEVGKAYVLNDLIRSDGKTYKALGGATSGTSTPIHERGSAYDGIAGVQWDYQHAGYGIARITGYTSPTSVSATVIADEENGLRFLPADVVSTTTLRWQLGSFSETSGYPTTITQWANRLWLGMGIRYFGSVPDDYENMAGDFFGETTADCAIWKRLGSADVNDILFMIGADKLIFGTGGGEFVGDKITTTDPVGPDNFQALLQSKRRVRGVKPVIAGTTVLYPQRAGRKLLALDYRLDIDRFSADDKTVLADRITRSGIAGLVFQNEPHSMLWARLANGKLLALTYDKDQDVFGWGRHPLGGRFGTGAAVVESMVVTPAPEGDRDELTLQVKRTINGVTVRTIEYLKPPYEGVDQDGTPGDDQEDCFYVDCGLTYDGAPNDTISGLDHLEGETVQVFADGAVHPDCIVSGGAITLNAEASVVQVGLACPARLVKLRLEAGSVDGTSQGKTKRIDHVTLRLVDSLSAKCGAYGGTLESFTLRSPSTPMGSAPPITSGDMRVPYPGGYDSDGIIEILCDQPTPFTLAAIIPRMKSYDDHS